MSRRFWPYVVGAPLILAAWATIYVGSTFWQPPGTPIAVVALGGSRAAIDAVINAGGAILEVRNGAVVAISDEAGFVQRLYREGPLVAFAARKGAGCGFGNARFAQAQARST